MPPYVFDNGAEDVFADMKDRARINAALIFPSNIVGYQYRRKHEQHAESGKTIDEIFVRTDPKYYEGTPYCLKPMEESAYSGRDVLDEAIDAGGKHGIDIYARILEAYRITDYNASLEAVAEVNQGDKPVDCPCFNHPDYLNYVLANWEDTLRLHPGLKGLKYGQERGSPMGAALAGEETSCFCEYCQRKARERFHFDLDRARSGWRALIELGEAAANHETRPADGWLASILRIWMRYPEVLAHHRMWLESREDHRRAIYELGKSINPELQIGWHIDHHWCWDLMGRAALDFADMTPHSDWLSIALYFDAAGPRMAGHFSRGPGRCFLGDLPKDLGLEAYRHFVGQNPAVEPSLEAMTQDAPLSAEHVYAETKRAVDRVNGQAKVYARVGFDLPMHNTKTTPEQVERAITRALDAGPDGLFLTREYHEVAPENLAAARRAIDAYLAS